jgi:hypothetical protein
MVLDDVGLVNLDEFTASGVVPVSGVVNQMGN